MWNTEPLVREEKRTMEDVDGAVEGRASSTCEATASASTAAADDAATAPPKPFVRLSKQEKKQLRAQQQIAKRLAWRQRRRETHRAATEERAAARRSQLDAMGEDERAAFLAAEQAERDRIYHEKVSQSRKLDEAFEKGLRIAIDLSYSDCMNAKEHASLSRQVTRCWGSNRRASAPVSLHLAGLASCPASCLPPGDQINSWKVHRVERDVADAFSRDELVYLSPDADEPLERLESHCVYVIGGIVDGSVLKRTTLERSAAVGAKAVRLPIAEHAPEVANSRLPLTLTAVLEILLAVHAGGEWSTALRAAVAPRHLRPPTWEHSRAARRADSRARAAASWGQPDPRKGAADERNQEGSDGANESEDDDAFGEEEDGEEGGDELEEAGPFKA